jgi:hypothetical protein
MKTKGLLLAAMALSGMSENLTNANEIKYVHQNTGGTDITPKESSIPVGFQRYYFNKYGECQKGEHAVFFDAIKRSYAFVKFERWLSSNNS